MDRGQSPRRRAGRHLHLLSSIVGTLRPGRGRGASAPEVKAATSVADIGYTISDADVVIDELVHPDRG